LENLKIIRKICHHDERLIHEVIRSWTLIFSDLFEMMSSITWPLRRLSMNGRYSRGNQTNKSTNFNRHNIAHSPLWWHLTELDRTRRLSTPVNRVKRKSDTVVCSRHSVGTVDETQWITALHSTRISIFYATSYTPGMHGMYSMQHDDFRLVVRIHLPLGGLKTPYWPYCRKWMYNISDIIMWFNMNLKPYSEL